MKDILNDAKKTVGNVLQANKLATDLEAYKALSKVQGNRIIALTTANLELQKEMADSSAQLKEQLTQAGLLLSKGAEVLLNAAEDISRAQ